MNCYEHNDVVAVGACAQGCGRGLCKACAEIYEPPTCAACVSQIVAIQKQEIGEIKSSLVKRISINGLFFIPYLMTVIVNEPPIWAGVLMLIWGFIGFRWLLDAFQSVTHLTIYNSLEGWGCTYLIGSGICAIFGYVVIPVLIIMELTQLKRISNLAETV